MVLGRQVLNKFIPYIKQTLICNKHTQSRKWLQSKKTTRINDAHGVWTEISWVPVSYLIPNGLPIQPYTDTKYAVCTNCTWKKAGVPALRTDTRLESWEQSKNAFVILQNTFAQLLESIANKQMEIIDKLEDRHDGRHFR